jgi:Zn-dependent protease
MAAEMEETERPTGGLAIFGVPVRFHFTFVLLIAFVVVGALADRRSAAGEALFLIGLFTSVLLHEVAHAITGRMFGVRTIEIVMYPIGGVARLERQPEPKAELWIALAGPATNLVIAGGLVAALGGLAAMAKLQDRPEAIWARLALWNSYIAAFNLVPALPMDGGRALRAVISMRRGDEYATRVAASMGKVLAVFMGLYGVYSGEVMIMLVALLIYMSASYESAASTGKALTQGIPVRAAMISDYRTLHHGATLREAADMLLATSQQDFPVVHGDQVVGLLDRTAFLRGMATQGPESFVAGAMTRDFLRIPPETDLAEAVARLSEAGSCGLVMDDDRLLGLLTTENVSEFLMLRKLGVQLKP